MSAQTLKEFVAVCIRYTKIRCEQYSSDLRCEVRGKSVASVCNCVADTLSKGNQRVFADLHSEYLKLLSNINSVQDANIQSKYATTKINEAYAKCENQ